MNFNNILKSVMTLTVDLASNPYIDLYSIIINASEKHY